jgi:hypothetical protein
MTNKPADRIDQQSCVACAHAKFAAMSCFGPDIYICTLRDAPVAADHSCGEWKAKDASDEKPAN